MGEILPRIRVLSEEVVHAHNAYLVDLSSRGDRHNQVLEIFVDTEAGITADGCAEISRDLSARLDHENIFPGRYNLVVSSPGLDRPLKLIRQYQKNVGRSLRVRHLLPEETKTIAGRLIQVTEQGIVLEEKSTREKVHLDFDRIEETKVEIDWGHGSR